jgi:diguanylate cyclase (GGDEF)-like protein
MLDGDPDSFAEKLGGWGDGSVRFMHRGKSYAAAFQPLGINKWFILTMTPEEDSIEQDSRVIDDLAATLVWRVLACFGAILAGILHFGNKSRKTILKSNKLLDINNRRFRIAAYHLSNDVVEYDVQKDLVYRVNQESEEPRPIDDIADGLIRNEVIDPDYLPALRESMEHIRKGAAYESCVVKTDRGNGRHGWYKVVFTGLLDSDQKPVKAVGTIEDVTRQRDTEIRFSLEEQQRRAMLAEAVESFVVNLTRERFMYGYDENHAETKLRASPDYGRELAALVAERIHPDARAEALRALSAKPLRDAFEAGKKKVEAELRAADREDGSHRWFSCLVNLVRDPESLDLIGYAYLRDITSTKLCELALQRDAELDPLTGLHNRQTTNRLIGEFLADPAALAQGVSAFLLIDLDRFKFVNDNYGHAAGDEVLVGMAEKLRSVIRRSDIVGRMGGDEFVVFLKNFADMEMVRKRADEICRTLKDITFSADPAYRVSGSVGVAPVSDRNANLTMLFEQADLALYAAKNRGKDQFALYDPAMRHNSVRLQD